MSTASFLKPICVLASTLVASSLVSACSRDVQAYDPQGIEQRYGVSGAYRTDLVTPDGTTMRGTTVVPVTLADGRQAQLVIPADRRTEPHTVYLRDSDGIHAVQVQDNVSRDDVTRAPRLVSRRAEPAHANKRSWEKDALIIGGGAGGGALIGALAAGKKGAAVGAASGGVGGLIYDLATRH